MTNNKNDKVVNAHVTYIVFLGYEASWKIPYRDCTLSVLYGNKL